MLRHVQCNAEIKELKVITPMFSEDGTCKSAITVALSTKFRNSLISSPELGNFSVPYLCHRVSRKQCHMTSKADNMSSPDVFIEHNTFQNLAARL